MIVSLSCILVLALGDGADRYPHADLLIEAAELKKPETARKFAILDARGKNKYLAGHIPGAVWVDQTTWSREFRTGQDRQSWTKRIGDLGIDVDTPVVIYDDHLAKDAARIWWILRYWGVKDVRLLNGGWPAWTAEGGKVDRSATQPEARQPKLAALSERRASKEQVLGWLKDNGPQLIDARSRGEYCGEEQTAKRNGAIPGAVHLEWSEALDSKTQRFKSPEELSRLLREAGIKLDRPAVTYCQSGGRAAVMAFTLELMGAKGVRNYYSSWNEWGNVEDTPIVKPKR